MELLNHIYWKQKAQFALASDCYESWVAFGVEDGIFRYEIASHSGNAGFGDLVVCPPGTPFVRQTVTPLTFHYFQFTSAAEDGIAPTAGIIHINDTKRLSSNYAYLREAAEDHSAAALTWKSHLATDLLRLHQLESGRKAQQRRFTEDALMAEAAEQIAAQAAGELSLRELAHVLALSPVQLTRRFREAYQETPSAYLKSLRLQKARSLLQETELTLAQIAERCGYENGFYLSRVFTKEAGVSPAAYRRQHRV